MKGRFSLIFITITFLLAGCTLPPEFLPYLPSIPNNTSNLIAYSVPTLEPTATHTPFQPVANTSTFTPSATATSTATPTITETQTPTTSLTSTWTGIPTQTLTITLTPTIPKTPTKPLSPSKTRTPTRTGSPTNTPENSYAAVASSTPTSTHAISLAETATEASADSVPLPYDPTSTSSSTPIDSSSPSPTQTITSTFTSVAVATPTNTATPSLAVVLACSPIYDSGLEAQVVSLINQERNNNGLPSLALQPALTAAARGHSQDMACNGYFSHVGSDGSSAWNRVASEGYSATWVGENIFGGMMSGPSGVVSWWMSSAPHRANILNTNYTSIGVGYVYVSTSPYQKYWTAVFARP